MKLQSLGATGTVTDSQYLLTDDRYRLPIHCGMYQGVRKSAPSKLEPISCRPRNKRCSVIDPRSHRPLGLFTSVSKERALGQNILHERNL